MPSNSSISEKVKRQITTLFALLVAISPGMVARNRAAAQNYEQQLKTVCRALSVRLIGQDKATAAVVDFTDLSGNVTALGRLVAEEISGCLVSKNAQLQVIERLRLSAGLREQKLGTSGIIDPRTAKKVVKSSVRR